MYNLEPSLQKAYNLLGNAADPKSDKRWGWLAKAAFSLLGVAKNLMPVTAAVQATSTSVMGN